MKHDLEAINSALRLGDRFTPPVGTVCTVRFNGVTVSEIWPQHVGHEWTFFPYEIEEVLDVPSDAPPFEEWERL